MNITDPGCVLLRSGLIQAT